MSKLQPVIINELDRLQETLELLKNEVRIKFISGIIHQLKISGFENVELVESNPASAITLDFSSVKIRMSHKNIPIEIYVSKNGDYIDVDPFSTVGLIVDNLQRNILRCSATSEMFKKIEGYFNDPVIYRDIQKRFATEAVKKL